MEGMQTAPMPLAARLGAFSLFSGLKPETIAAFARHAQAVMAAKGTTLFLPETANEKLFFIETGWVKIFRQTLDGAEIVTDTLTSSHWFGEIGLAGSEPLPYGAEVIEDAALISLPRFLLAEEVLRNGPFGLKILQELTRQKAQKDMEVEHLAAQTAPQRLGCLILKLCPARQGEASLTLPYDKLTLASRLGMQPETLSRALSKLKDATSLSIKGHTIHIPDIKALADYTCGACSSRFPCPP